MTTHKSVLPPCPREGGILESMTVKASAPEGDWSIENEPDRLMCTTCGRHFKLRDDGVTVVEIEDYS